MNFRTGIKFLILGIIVLGPAFATENDLPELARKRANLIIDCLNDREKSCIMKVNDQEISIRTSSVTTGANYFNGNSESYTFDFKDKDEVVKVLNLINTKLDPSLTKYKQLINGLLNQ